MTKSRFDPARFYASLPEKLREAQTRLEASVEAFGEASDAEVENLKKYREKRSTWLLRGKSEGIPATILENYVSGVSEVAEAEQNYLKAKAQKDKCKFYIEAYKERIYNIRHLGKDMDILTKVGQ